MKSVRAWRPRCARPSSNITRARRPSIVSPQSPSETPHDPAALEDARVPRRTRGVRRRGDRLHRAHRRGRAAPQRAAAVHEVAPAGDQFSARPPQLRPRPADAHRRAEPQRFLPPAPHAARQTASRRGDGDAHRPTHDRCDVRRASDPAHDSRRHRDHRGAAHPAVALAVAGVRSHSSDSGDPVRQSRRSIERADRARSVGRSAPARDRLGRRRVRRPPRPLPRTDHESRHAHASARSRGSDLRRLRTRAARLAARARSARIPAPRLARRRAPRILDPRLDRRSAARAGRCRLRDRIPGRHETHTRSRHRQRADHPHTAVVAHRGARDLDRRPRTGLHPPTARRTGGDSVSDVEAPLDARRTRDARRLASPQLSHRRARAAAQRHHRRHEPRRPAPRAPRHRRRHSTRASRLRPALPRAPRHRRPRASLGRIRLRSGSEAPLRSDVHVRLVADAGRAPLAAQRVDFVVGERRVSITLERDERVVHRYFAGQKTRFLQEWREILQSGHLLYNLVHRDLTVRYKRSSFCALWTLLHPLLLTGILVIVFSHIFRFDIEHYEIYLLSGLLPWTFFAQTTVSSMAATAWNGPLMKRVRVPKSIFALSTTISGIINLAISYLPLVGIMVIRGIHFKPDMLFLPVSIAILAVFTFGLSLP